MDSLGRISGAFEGEPSSAQYRRYLELEKSGFRDIATLSTGELEAALHIHRRRMEHYREERRMHFGAMCLVALAFVILLPAVLYFEEYMIPLAAADGLLLCLLAPYIFVYRRYEEGLRGMIDDEFRMEDLLLSSRSSSLPS